MAIRGRDHPLPTSHTISVGGQRSFVRRPEGGDVLWVHGWAAAMCLRLETSHEGRTYRFSPFSPWATSVLTIFLKNHPLTPGYLLAMLCMIPSLS